MPRVIIPWRGGCADRERALTWVLAQYAQVHPRWDVAVAPCPTEGWCKAAAVMPAVAAAPADVVIVADADVWCWGLERAVLAVTCDVAPWAVPHYAVHRLDAAGTALLIAGDAWEGHVCERPYRGLLGGGVVVAHRDTILAAPMDPRFVGWGQEDTCWAMALETTAGHHWRGRAKLAHLWHPPPARNSRRRGNPVGMALRMRYAGANRRPAAMRALLDEINACESTQHTVPDRAPAAIG